MFFNVSLLACGDKKCAPARLDQTRMPNQVARRRLTCRHPLYLREQESCASLVSCAHVRAVTRGLVPLQLLTHTRPGWDSLHMLQICLLDRTRYPEEVSILMVRRTSKLTGQCSGALSGMLVGCCTASIVITRQRSESKSKTIAE